MPRIRLIHTNPQEGRQRAETLRAAGYQVSYDAAPDEALRKIKRAAPAALVVDLDRSPSMGRDVAVAVREQKKTRHVPIVFAGGTEAKIARVKATLPDATFTPWSRIRSALKRAIARPPTLPVKPASRLAGYSGTPLAKKLTIKEGMTVALVRAPPDFEATLGGLPEGVTIRRQARGKRDITIWFAKTRRDLARCIERSRDITGSARLWIAWPKQASAIETDLTQNHVRREGLAVGLVDYKICAIDATWSGLLFVRRKRG